MPLRPGRVTLADWLDIYRGARIALDPIAQADVEIGAAALAAINASAEILSPPAMPTPTPLTSLCRRNRCPQPSSGWWWL